MWTGKIVPDIVKAAYGRRRYFPPKLFEQLHGHLSAFAARKNFEDGFLSAMALLLIEKPVKELGFCEVHGISKAMGTALQIYDAMLDDVGVDASKRAWEILEVWTEADPHWEQYSSHYECKPREGPLACVKTFVLPVIRDWVSEYWAPLIRRDGVRASGDTLEKTLSLDFRGIVGRGPV